VLRQLAAATAKWPLALGLRNELAVELTFAAADRRQLEAARAEGTHSHKRRAPRRLSLARLGLDVRAGPRTVILYGMMSGSYQQEVAN